MQSEKLLELTRAMKLEILEILIYSDLSNDREAQRTILTIDSLFDRLDIEVDEVIPRDILTEYYKGVDEATKALSREGIDPINGIQASIMSNGQVRAGFATQVHYQAITELTDDTMLDLKAAIRTARQNTYFTLMTSLADVKEKMQSGLLRGDTRIEMTRRVASAFEADGMTAFITRDNKRLPLDFYSETVVRTNLKLANTRGALNRYTENGQDYVIIGGHSPTCSMCHAHRGLVVNISGTDRRFPTAFGNTPPFHPNCRCTVSPYVMEYKTDDDIEMALEQARGFNPSEDNRSEREKQEYAKEQSIKRRLNYEKKRYIEMKSVLGDEMPKTLGGFRRSKRSNSENYKKLLKEYREAIKAMES